LRLSFDFIIVVYRQR